jgi:hypothetical protein
MCVQVTAGSALGVVSLGQDSLMSTTYKDLWGGK